MARWNSFQSGELSLKVAGCQCPDIQFHIVRQPQKRQLLSGVFEVIQRDSVPAAFQLRQMGDVPPVRRDVLQHFDHATLRRDNRHPSKQSLRIVDKDRPRRRHRREADFEEGPQDHLGAGPVRFLNSRGRIGGRPPVKELVALDLPVGIVDRLSPEIAGRLA
jgi:hypothetical protein